MDTRATRLLEGRYRLVERLGVGGMSVVWRGYDEVLGRQVAIKVLAPTLAPDAAFRHRIRAEAQAAARLCHPNITNVYDYGEAREPDGSTVPYVVMELIDGEALAARLRHGGRLPWREAVVACAEVASALAVAHARGVVHRDVTPNNVMLTAAGAKVVDFGISALVGESDVGPDGALLGTPAYLAPERMDGGAVSPATDVYALGLLLYRSLTGRLPWRAGTTTQMLKAHRYAEPQPMPAVAELPAEVVALCHRCLAKHPADRPTSAEVARTLAAAAGIVVFLPGPARARGDEAGADGAAEHLGSLGTTILPWSASTRQVPAEDAAPARTRRGPTPRAPGGPRRPPTLAGARDRVAAASPAVRRRAEALLLAAALLTVTGLIWAGTSGSPGGSPDGTGGGVAGAQALGLGLGGSRPSCQVDYVLRRDDGRTFAAAVTVTNTGRTAVEGWRLEFAFPGDQRVERGVGGQWRQSGRSVRVTPPAARATLAPGDAARLTVDGTYRGANALPVVFRLDDGRVGGDDPVCEAVVSGLSGGTAAGGAATSSTGSGTAAGGGAAKQGRKAAAGKGSKGKGKGGSGNSGRGGG